MCLSLTFQPECLALPTTVKILVNLKMGIHTQQLVVMTQKIFNLLEYYKNNLIECVKCRKIMACYYPVIQ